MVCLVINMTHRSLYNVNSMHQFTIGSEHIHKASSFVTVLVYLVYLVYRVSSRSHNTGSHYSDVTFHVTFHVSVRPTSCP
jgi:hypothetical protein